MSNGTDMKSKLYRKYDKYRRLRRIRIILVPFVLMFAFFYYNIGSMFFKMGAYQYSDKNPGDGYRQCIEEKFETVLPDDLVIEEVWGGTMGYSSSDNLVYLRVNYTPEQWNALGIECFRSESDEDRSGNADGSKLTIHKSDCPELMELLSANGKPHGSLQTFHIMRWSGTVVIIVLGVFPILTILRTRTWKKIVELDERL